MKVVVLVAGTNQPSNSNALADAFVQGMEQFGAVEVEKIRLKDVQIEHFTLDFYDPQCHQEEDFCKVQQAIESSDAMVIATPIWNFSVPAHLKNLIDRMGSFALDETRSRGTLGGKPFFLIFTGGAPEPAWKFLMKKTTSSIAEALKYFGGSDYGSYFEGKCVKGQGKFGLVVDERPATLAAVRKKGHSFARDVAEFVKTGTPPLKHRVTAKATRLGEKLLKKLF